MWRFPYSCVFHWSGTPWGYRPRVTLPQENPLIWQPPLQQNSLSTQGSKLECVEGRSCLVQRHPNKCSCHGHQLYVREFLMNKPMRIGAKIRLVVFGINRQTDLTNSRWNSVTSLVGCFGVISLATIVVTCNLIRWTTSHKLQAYLGLLMRLFKHDLVNCWG
jgi:hypothetical protein